MSSKVICTARPGRVVYSSEAQGMIDEFYNGVPRSQTEFDDSTERSSLSAQSDAGYRAPKRSQRETFRILQEFLDIPRSREI